MVTSEHNPTWKRPIFFGVQIWSSRLQWLNLGKVINYHVQMGVEAKIGVFTPKMDGENNGSNPIKMGWSVFLETPTSSNVSF